MRLLASLCLSVCPHGTTRLSSDGFSWSFISQYFSEIPSRKFKFLLKSDQNNRHCTCRPIHNNRHCTCRPIHNNRHCTCRPIHIFHHISLSCSYNGKRFGQKLHRKSKHILCSITLFFPKIVSFARWGGKLLCSRTGNRWQYGACALHAGYIMLQTHTQNM